MKIKELIKKLAKCDQDAEVAALRVWKSGKKSTYADYGFPVVQVVLRNDTPYIAFDEDNEFCDVPKVEVV